MSEPVTLPEANKTADEVFVHRLRTDLEHSCAALDGHTLSRLKRIRYAALERRHPRRRSLLLPFGGLVSASVLVLAVLLTGGPVAVEAPAGSAAPLEDLEILSSSEDLDFYENYEFYQWLADNGSSI